MAVRRRTDHGRRWLVAAGALSAIAAALHLAIIAGGGDWYRFFGAGEGMARMAERGYAYPTFMAIFIAAVLATWAAFAFSGAGLIRRLPLLRTGLVAISLVYLGRACVLPYLLLIEPDLLSPFWVWSSAIVAIYGASYAIGTWLAWPELGPAAGTATR